MILMIFCSSRKEHSRTLDDNVPFCTGIPEELWLIATRHDDAY